MRTDRRLRGFQDQADTRFGLLEVRVRIDALGQGKDAPEVILKVVEAGNGAAELAVERLPADRYRAR